MDYKIEIKKIIKTLNNFDIYESIIDFNVDRSLIIESSGFNTWLDIHVNKTGENIYNTDVKIYATFHVYCCLTEDDQNTCICSECDVEEDECNDGYFYFDTRKKRNDYNMIKFFKYLDKKNITLKNLYLELNRLLVDNL